jgi:peptide/nickel transport system permease protein
MGIVLFCTLLVFIGNTVASLLLARINRGWEGEHAV